MKVNNENMMKVILMKIMANEEWRNDEMKK